MTEPLPEAIQLFNQRLLAEGCLSADRAESLWETDLRDVDKGNVTQLKKALSASNRQLAAVGLEIRGVIMESNDDNEETTAYYAMVNVQADEMAKLGFVSSFGNTTEINYIRLILETLASEGPTTKANLLNLKNSLKDKNDSLTMDQAVAVVDRLLREQWIWPAKSGGNRRQSTMKTPFAMAPRTFMELSYMLVEQFGMENAELPQQIHF